MYKVTIIGWYGTETIGDRAILAGIIRILFQSANDVELQIGALYPVLSQRTLLEDYDFYKICAGKDFAVTIFDSTKVKQLNRSIKWCNVLLVGGGPLMDLDGISMLDYALRYAHSLKKRTMLLGCGWGPLNVPFFISCAHRLIRNADVILMRDEFSVEQSRCSLPQALKNKRMKGLIDPAFFAAKKFIDNKNQYCREENRISINLRDMFYDLHYVTSEFRKVFAIQKNIVKKMATRYRDNEILLIPMHTFHIGGDDRYILNQIAWELKLDNITVQNNPLSLKETMEVYYHSCLCVGMRFHSIVLQTMVNGKNYILDYTDPHKGKIISMMQQLHLKSFYKDRYLSLQDLSSNNSEFMNTCNDVTRYIPSGKLIEEYFNEYVKETKKLING